MWLPFSGQAQSLSLAVLFPCLKFTAPEICGWESASFHAPGPLTSVFIPSLPCQTASLCCHGPSRPLTQGLASEFLGHRLGFYVDPGAAGLAGKCSAARGLWFALVGVSYALLVLPTGRKHRRPGPCSSSGTSVFSSAKWEVVTLLRVEEGGSVGMCVKWAASKRRQLTARGSLDFLICVLRTEPQRMSSGTPADLRPRGGAAGPPSCAREGAFVPASRHNHRSPCPVEWKGVAFQQQP